jgi:hypothetical protein
VGKIFIKDGRLVGAELLFKTCSWAVIFAGYRESEQTIICTRMDPNIVLPFTVNTCTGCYDKNRPSYKQMQDLAIDVTPAPLKPVGFKVGAQEPIRVRTRVNVDLNEDDDD